MTAQTLAIMLLPALVEMVAALIGARRRRSAGGRKITRAEWAAIRDRFLARVLARVGVEIPPEAAAEAE